MDSDAPHATRVGSRCFLGGPERVARGGARAPPCIHPLAAPLSSMPAPHLPPTSPTTPDRATCSRPRGSSGAERHRSHLGDGGGGAEGGRPALPPPQGRGCWRRRYAVVRGRVGRRGRPTSAAAPPPLSRTSAGDITTEAIWNAPQSRPLPLAPWYRRVHAPRAVLGLGCGAVGERVECGWGAGGVRVGRWPRRDGEDGLAPSVRPGAVRAASPRAAAAGRGRRRARSPPPLLPVRRDRGGSPPSRHPPATISRSLAGAVAGERTPHRP